MNRWTEILDHGNDPGRYTLVNGKGQVVTANENGSVIFTRKCKNPRQLVFDLSREKGIKIVPPADQFEVLKKINNFIKGRENGNNKEWII